MSDGGQNQSEFDAFRSDIDEAERRIAREIEPGARALVVSILVFVLLASFILPHTGDVRGSCGRARSCNLPPRSSAVVPLRNGNPEHCWKPSTTPPTPSRRTKTARPRQTRAAAGRCPHFAP